MNHLTTDQLAELTAQINARFDEFAVGNTPVFEPVTMGVVRLVYAVIQEFGNGPVAIVQEPPKVPAIAAPEPVTPKDVLLDFSPATASLSDFATSALGPEHVQVTPLPERFDEKDSLVHSRRQADFNDIIDELKRLAMGGIMPSMATWDTSRQAKFPKAGAIIARFEKGWGELADAAGLQMERQRRPVKADVNGI